MKLNNYILLIGLLCVSVLTIAGNSHASSGIANENPSPINRYLVWDASFMQTHFFDGADSVWIDGDWHDKGTLGPRYIFTFYRTKYYAKKPVIAVLNMNIPSSNPAFVEPLFASPRDIGHIAINSITKSGKEKWMLLHFISTSGVTGTFNLQTLEWRFSTTRSNSAFVNIDPVRPLDKIMSDRYFGTGETWIDGDWHTNSGGFGARYVSIDREPGSKVKYIRVVDMNRGKRNGYFYYLMPLIKMYPFPRQIGHSTISNIVGNGSMVEFTSGSGIHGKWNIVTHKWQFGGYVRDNHV